MNNALLVAGAALGAAGVVLGAFGAHALKNVLDPARLSTWDTAVTYQLFHALAIVLAFLVGRHFPGSALPGYAGWLFVAGVVMFSGSLYALGLGAPRWLGPITPLGGVALIAGWCCLAATALRQPA